MAADGFKNEYVLVLTGQIGPNAFMYMDGSAAMASKSPPNPLSSRIRSTSSQERTLDAPFL